MLNINLGDKVVSKLSCLSDHYVHRQSLPLHPGCNGCDWIEICCKIMVLIKENKEK